MHHAIYFQIETIMAITIILLQFYLLIILIARIIPSSGCSHRLEAFQLIHDANRLTGFPVTSIEWQFRTICKDCSKRITFFSIGRLYYYLFYVEQQYLLYVWSI